MLDLTRRRFLTGLVAAPIVITTPKLLMPVKALDPALLRPVREVRIRAIRHHRSLYNSIEAGIYHDPAPAKPDIPSPIPTREYQVAGLPIAEVKRHHVAGMPIGGGHFLADEVIEFTTPDKPFYWGDQFGRGGLAGQIINVGHPAVDGGEYRVVSLMSLDDGDLLRTEPAPLGKLRLGEALS